MQSFVQEPTYLGLLFSVEGAFAYSIWCITFIGCGVLSCYDAIAKKSLLTVLTVSILSACFALPISNYFDFKNAKSSYNACFTNGQPKDNTKYVDGECFVKYDGYIKYDAQVK